MAHCAARAILGSNTLYDLYDNHNITYFSMYGDAAYPLSELLIKGFPFDCEFNSILSKLRITVEWGFKEISNYFPWVDCKKKLKICEAAVGKRIIVASLLANARCLCYGNEISNYFDCQSRPSLEEYFGWASSL